LKHEKGKRTPGAPIVENHEVAAGMNNSRNEEGEKESDA
jgi:hypothetical protein